MDTFSPEFSAYWRDKLAEVDACHGVEGARGREALSASQQAALEELAERVNAARSVV